jgi:hypothetical protein
LAELGVEDAAVVAAERIYAPAYVAYGGRGEHRGLAVRAGRTPAMDPGATHGRVLELVDELAR